MFRSYPAAALFLQMFNYVSQTSETMLQILGITLIKVPDFFRRDALKEQFGKDQTRSDSRIFCNNSDKIRVTWKKMQNMFLSRDIRQNCAKC